jgi:hypothetical protein
MLRAAAFTKAGEPPGCPLVLGALECSSEGERASEYLHEMRVNTMIIRVRMRRGVRDGYICSRVNVDAMATFVTTFVNGPSGVTLTLEQLPSRIPMQTTKAAPGMDRGRLAPLPSSSRSWGWADPGDDAPAPGKRARTHEFRPLGARAAAALPLRASSASYAPSHACRDQPAEKVVASCTGIVRAMPRWPGLPRSSRADAGATGWGGISTWELQTRQAVRWLGVGGVLKAIHFVARQVVAGTSSTGPVGKWMRWNHSIAHSLLDPDIFWKRSRLVPMPAPLGR